MRWIRKIMLRLGYVPEAELEDSQSLQERTTAALEAAHTREEVLLRKNVALEQEVSLLTTTAIGLDRFNRIHSRLNQLGAQADSYIKNI